MIKLQKTKQSVTHAKYPKKKKKEKEVQKQKQ